MPLAVWRKSFALAVVPALSTLTMWIYVPLRFSVFDIRDFSEFLPVLARAPGLFNGFRELSGYYLTQGRVAFVTYAYISLNWKLCGTSPQAWQVSQFFAMSVVCVAAYLLLRRLGMQRASSLAGAVLFLVSSPAADAWNRLTGEPLATVCFFGAAALARGYLVYTKWKLRAFQIFLAALGMTFAKETMIACLPFVLLVAGHWDKGVVGDATSRRKLIYLCGLLAAVICLVAGAALAASTVREPRSYATLYGSAGASPWSLLRAILITLAPSAPPVSRWYWAILFPPNVTTVIIWILGALAASGLGLERNLWYRRIGIAAVLPMSAALIYLPWPRFELFYALPFSLAPSIIVALAFDALRLAPRLRVAATTLFTFTLLGSGMLSHDSTRHTIARRTVEFALAKLLPTFPSSTTVLVATPELSEQSWQNAGATLRRYALASGAGAIPVVKDTLCLRGDNLGVDTLHDIVVINYSSGCGSLRLPSRVIEESFPTFDWPTFSWKESSVRSEVFMAARSAKRIGRQDVPPTGGAPRAGKVAK